jgi:hypothetical protein
MSTLLRALAACAIGLLLSSRADAEPAPVAPADVKANAPVVYTSAGVGSILATPHGPGPSATGTLRLGLPFGRLFSAELFLSAGYALLPAEPNSFWGRIGLGLRVGKNGPTFTPYGAFRLVHMHYAPAEVWWEHPGSSILGSSADGLQHSSGMAAAAGVSWPFPFPKTRGHLRGMAELEASWIPIGNAPPWFLTGEVGVGYAF